MNAIRPLPTSALLVEALDALASKFIGDAKGLNAYFVTDSDDHVDTVTFDFRTAWKRWRDLSSQGIVSTLEDRLHRVLAVYDGLGSTDNTFNLGLHKGEWT